MRVFLSTGEASGDAYGAALIREMRNRVTSPDSLQFEVAGGKRLRETGAKVVADSSTWGAMGIAQSLRILPRAWKGVLAIRRALATGTPGLFVPIDFGFLNIRLARFAKRKGWKVLYFIPPGSWRRDRQGQDLPRVCDEIVTPFFWSAETLKRMGAHAHCFGHPGKQLVREREKELLSTGHEDRLTIAVLPGSRHAEIDVLLPIIAAALKGEKRLAEFAVAPTFSPEELRARWLKLLPERAGDMFTSDDTYGVLYRARAGIICSGTATLEAALCVCPHVVVYRVGKLLEWQLRSAGFKEEFISQPNILLGKAAVPELIQEGATPERIREYLDKLLAESEERRQQIWSFMELDSLLGPPDAIGHTADLALTMLVAMGKAVTRIEASSGSPATTAPSESSVA